MFIFLLSVSGNVSVASFKLTQILNNNIHAGWWSTIATTASANTYATSVTMTTVTVATTILLSTTNTPTSTSITSTTTITTSSNNNNKVRINIRTANIHLAALGRRVMFVLSQVTGRRYQRTKHTEGTYSLTTLIPSDRAEPIMHLTTVSIEEFLILKHSSWALTWAISYTALTDTIPAVSWPSHTKDFRLER